jgi:very-short-patch-repair endonuclease
MIALYEWAKREGVSYSHAQKLFNENKIDGAQRVKKRIQVPAETKAPQRETVTCIICGKAYPQITGTHMKLHGMTMDQYKAAYPGVTTVSGEITRIISETNIGKVYTQETIDRISVGRSGIEAWNKGLSGVVKDTPETIEKKRQAHLGKTHTEESKRKIGEGNAGKVMPREDVERRRLALIERYTNEVHPNAGRKFDEFHSAMMSEVAKRREATYTAEQKAILNEKRGAPSRGLKRTDAQKETYRAARVKWMSENPEKVVNTTGEKSVAEWLDQHRIIYKRQFVIPDFFHPYDFFLPDHDTILEFDGAHHWWRPWFKVLGKSKAERDEMMRLQMEKDAMENLIAGLSGYRIIRIRGVADCGDSPEYGSLEYQLQLQGFEMP